jgi:hypothetical protein
MKAAFLCAVIISLCGATAVRQSPGAESAKPARTVITKVFHDKHPAQSPPRLLRDVLGNAEVDWNAVAQRAARGETTDEFRVTWNATHQSKLVVRLEYRQQNAPTVKMKQQQASATRGKTHFAVSADELQSDGDVTAWRVTILDGEKLLASKQSFMW